MSTLSSGKNAEEKITADSVLAELKRVTGTHTSLLVGMAN
jgi:hypothetical protein